MFDWFMELGKPELKPIIAAVGILGSALIAGFGIGQWWHKKREQLQQEHLTAATTQLQHANTLLEQKTGHLQNVQTQQQTTTAELARSKDAYKQLAQKYNDTVKKAKPYYDNYLVLKPKFDQLQQELKSHRQMIDLLKEELNTAGGTNSELLRKIDQREQTLKKRELRFKKAIKLAGTLWLARATQKVPKAKSLQDRKTPIVSMLNLKGGVGKTTLTAQIGAAFARTGYRVLLIDLDLQGSLSGLFVPQQELNKLQESKRVLTDFFHSAKINSSTKLEDYIFCGTELPGGGRIDIVPTTDQMSYAELNLTLTWLLAEGERDVRFLLRKAIHRLGLCKQYDLILLDCPPVLNISCINALAASDYVLVPTLPQPKSLERIGKLIEVLEHGNFKKWISSHLKVLGCLVNRTFKDTMTAEETAMIGDLVSKVKQSTLQTLHPFAQVIPGMKDLGTDAEYQHPEAGSKIATVFAKLQSAIAKELPHESRIAAPAPGQPGNDA